ncbi:MAG: putative selenium-dependent hydroxylase accessory protein YqeC [Synergistaceae bacterium]|nr:putative selenium-dependent hydroxylase accessory protein YqeC [Synergistaceae bacterium]
MSLSGLLGLGRGSRVAVSGCGGKTSVINILAGEAGADMSVLVTPTAKIFPVTDAGADFAATREECLAHVPRPGIHCLGLLNGKTGKLEALAPEDLAAIAPRYDIVLMEADGSGGLPCKGWTENEPVIPDFATHTLGVVSVNAVGLAASAENVFRPDEFLKLTGLNRGDAVTAEALAAMVASPGGMLRRRAGHVAIVINQAEDERGRKIALKTAALIREARDMPLVIVSGNARMNRWSGF